jgi:hypothetical protein
MVQSMEVPNQTLFKDEISQLLEMSVSQSTFKIYSCGLDSLCKFRIVFGLEPPWPVPLQVLIYYIFVHCPSIQI